MTLLTLVVSWMMVAALAGIWDNPTQLRGRMIGRHRSGCPHQVSEPHPSQLGERPLLPAKGVVRLADSDSPSRELQARRRTCARRRGVGEGLENHKSVRRAVGDCLGGGQNTR